MTEPYPQITKEFTEFVERYAVMDVRGNPGALDTAMRGDYDVVEKSGLLPIDRATFRVVEEGLAPGSEVDVIHHTVELGVGDLNFCTLDYYPEGGLGLLDPLGDRIGGQVVDDMAARIMERIDEVSFRGGMVLLTDASDSTPIFG